MRWKLVAYGLKHDLICGPFLVGLVLTKELITKAEGTAIIKPTKGLDVFQEAIPVTKGGGNLGQALGFACLVPVVLLEFVRDFFHFEHLHFVALLVLEIGKVREFSPRTNHFPQ